TLSASEASFSAASPRLTVAKNLAVKVNQYPELTGFGVAVRLAAIPPWCAVKRRVFSVGATPTRQLSLQPVEIGTAAEVTKPSKPSMERVASGDPASRQAATCVNAE